MTDAFGEPLKLGDVVAYGYDFKGEIIEIRKHIKVRALKMGGNQKGAPPYRTYEKWVDPLKVAKTLEKFESYVTFKVVDHNGNEEVL